MAPITDTQMKVPVRKARRAVAMLIINIFLLLSNATKSPRTSYVLSAGLGALRPQGLVHP